MDGFYLARRNLADDLRDTISCTREESFRENRGFRFVTGIVESACLEKTAESVKRLSKRTGAWIHRTCRVKPRGEFNKIVDFVGSGCSNGIFHRLDEFGNFVTREVVASFSLKCEKVLMSNRSG